MVAIKLLSSPTKKGHQLFYVGDPFIIKKYNYNNCCKTPISKLPFLPVQPRLQ